jgi:hypothetical protein
MTTFAILNVETGDFYSESPALRKEFKRAGIPWINGSILPAFARRYTRFKAAIRRSQQVSNKTGCICEVVIINDTPIRVAA